jgi:hypothetical protein
MAAHRRVSTSQIRNENPLSTSGPPGCRCPPKVCITLSGEGLCVRIGKPSLAFRWTKITSMKGKPSRRRRDTRKSTNAEPAHDVVAWQDEVDLAHVPPDERFEVLRMLEPHHRMWDGRLGTVAATTYRIEVLPGSKPVHAQPYRAGSHARVAEKTEIDRMLAQQVIESAHVSGLHQLFWFQNPTGPCDFTWITGD